MRWSCSIIAYTMVTLLICLGCADTKTGPQEQKIGALENQVNAIQKELKDMRLQLLRLSVKGDMYKSISIDTSDKGFQRLDTSLGSFLVSVNDVKPYSNGYKLVLNVGNPYSASFKGITIKAKWGPAFDSKVSESDEKYYENWQKSFREKEETMTDELKPGTWNVLTLILSPAKAEDLGLIELSMSVSQTSLMARRR
jgi:hypothetical protein